MSSRTGCAFLLWSLFVLVFLNQTHGLKYLSDLIANLNRTCESLEQWQNWITTTKTVLPPMVLSAPSQYVLIASCKRVPLDASGVYLYQPSESVYPFPVYCDQETFIGSHGWTVIQNRAAFGQLSFNRSWAEYRDGFGTPQGEFWLGLERVHRLLQRGRFELSVVLKTRDGRMAAARYASVAVAGEEQGYRLDVGSYVYGSAGKTMDYSHGANFSTPDRDQGGKNCAQQMASGWWFADCDQVVQGSGPVAPRCDKEHHPYRENFYMGDPCLLETRIMVREVTSADPIP